MRKTWTSGSNTPSTTKTPNELPTRGRRLGPDPFKSGENPRPWLILNNDRHPFGGEEYMTVTLTTTPHDAAIPIEAADWVEGGMPKQSYASPWTVASPKHAAIVRRQGRLREDFVQTVVEATKTYLDPPANVQ